MPAPANPMQERILGMLRRSGRPMAETELFNWLRLGGWTMARFVGLLEHMKEEGILSREVRHEPMSINKTGYRDFNYYRIIEKEEDRGMD